MERRRDLAMGYARRRGLRYLSRPVRRHLSDLQISRRRLFAAPWQMRPLLPYALSDDLDSTGVLQGALSDVQTKI